MLTDINTTVRYSVLHKYEHHCAEKSYFEKKYVFARLCEVDIEFCQK